MWFMTKDQLIERFVDGVMREGTSTYSLVLYAADLLKYIVDEQGFEDTDSRDGAKNLIKDLEHRIGGSKIEPKPKYRIGEKILLQIDTQIENDLWDYHSETSRITGILASDKEYYYQLDGWNLYLSESSISRGEDLKLTATFRRLK